MRKAIVVLMLILGVIATVFAAENTPAVKPAADRPAASEPITQADFARRLVKVFGWDNGVPKEPKDRDYLVIFEGRRTLKFEAEAVYNKRTDPVVPRDYELYGPFSGVSWLGGTSVPTTIHMKVFIPIDGDYTIRAAIKGDGHVWKLAGKEYRVGSGGRLTETLIATIPLKAGELQIELTMPPEGGVDYLLFTAPDLAPIEPLNGWRFSSPMTKFDLSGIAASLLGWEDRLPPDEKAGSVTVDAVGLPNLPPTIIPVTTNFGQPAGKKWLRALNSTEVEIPFNLSRTGYYSIKIRYKGAILKASLDGFPIQRPAKSLLDWVDLGGRRILDGEHSLRVAVPAYDGLDILVIEPRLSTPAAYLQLVGITGDPGSTVTAGEAERFLTQFVERFTSRR